MTNLTQIPGIGKNMGNKSKLLWFEKYFFLFFGIFHMHRIWGLIDCRGYSDFGYPF